MKRPWYLLSASVLGFLASVPLAVSHALFFFATWQQYEINKKYGCSLTWEPGQPWIGIAALAFSILMMILAVGIARAKEWARRLAVRIVAPCLAALLITTWVALAQTPSPPAAPLAVGSGIGLAIILFCLVLLVPIAAVWWQILLTQQNIRCVFSVSFSEQSRASTGNNADSFTPPCG
ncbi:MAG TPA: hypothetical protein VGR55_09500 [Candidatus Acidoferrum sp.]|nr:hypothetical protein [Candidatus Acidoferrum sp.]